MPDAADSRARRRRSGYVFGPTAAGADVELAPPRPGEASPSAPGPPEREGPDLLGAIREGMPVADAAGAVIGHVRVVARGEADDPGVALAPELRARVGDRSFVLIDTPGTLAARCAFPEQIAGVSDDEVRLSVWRDQLLRAS